MSCAVVVLVAILACACGRVGFDAARDGVADASSGDATMPAGALVHFSFDEGSTMPVDGAGGRTTSCSTGACPTVIPGRSGSALAFDGIDDCLEVATTPPLAPQRFTIALWARQSETGPMTFVSQPYFANDPTGNSWEVEAGFNLDFSLSIQHGATQTTLETISGQVALDTWFHVAFRWNGLTHAIYVDGVLVREEVAPSDAIPYDGTPWLVGCDRNTATVQPTRGALDELWIFDRALTGPEIAALAGA